MPNVTVKYYDLIGLVGKDLSIRDLEGIAPNIKCEWEGVDGEDIKLETTHDRPDMVSAEGIARAIRNYVGLPADIPAFHKSDYVCDVDKSVLEERPYSRMFVVKGIKLTSALIEQLMQVQEKIHLVYANDRKDASIGVYDLDTFAWPITYCAKEEYKFTPLGEEREMTCREVLTKTEKGRDYAHLVKGRYPLIIDKNGRVLSLPPVLNSEETKVTGTTTNLFCDVSGWDGEVVEKVAALLACALSERGEIYYVTMKYPDHTIESPELKKESTTASVMAINKLIGSEFSPHECIGLLAKSGFHAKAQGDSLEVVVPPYRYDLMHPVDIAEEIAIAYGYNEFKPLMPEVPTIGIRHPLERLSEQAREALVGAGFQEVLTFILCSKRILEAAPGPPFAELENPVSDEYNAVRSWLVPRHLDFLAKNKHLPLPHRVFEAEDIVITDGKETYTRRNVSASICNSTATFTEMHSVLDSLMKNLGKEYTLKPGKHDTFLRGRCGVVMVNGKEAGVIGEIHPKVLNAFELENPVVSLELCLDELL